MKVKERFICNKNRTDAIRITILQKRIGLLQKEEGNFRIPVHTTKSTRYCPLAHGINI